MMNSKQHGYRNRYGMLWFAVGVNAIFGFIVMIDQAMIAMLLGIVTWMVIMVLLDHRLRRRSDELARKQNFG